MNQSMTKRITRTGLLLAATLILQGLRLFIPVPPQVSMFVIGSLVNACLVLAVWSVGRKAGLVVACVTPVFAWLEGMLPFLPFIFPVAAGNCAFVLAVGALRRHCARLPSCTALFMSCSAMWNFLPLYGT